MIIAGTGHRPKSCPCGYDLNHIWLEDLRKRLRQALMDSQIETVIWGCALGFDTWLAEEALKVGKKIHAYMPFPNQGEKWPKFSRDKLTSLLNKSEKVVMCNEAYSWNAFLIRDRDMVNNCDEVFCLLNPSVSHSGTGHTVNYARSLDKKVTNFWKDYVSP